MSMHLSRVFTVLFCCILLLQCKKEDKEKLEPSDFDWNITTPSSNAIFTLPDTIWVNLTVSAPENIKLLKLTLKNENNLIVADSKTLTYNSQEVVLNSFIVPNVSNTVDGKHYISVEARTDNQVDEQFIEVFIESGELRLLSTFLFTPSGGKTTIYRNVDDDWEQFADLSFVSSRFHINSVDQQMMLMTKSNGLYAVNTVSGDVVWNLKESDLPAEPIDSSVYFDQNITYLSDESGKIHGVNQNNQFVYNAQTSSDFLATKIVRSGDFIITLQENQLSPNQRLVTSFITSGEEKFQLPINSKPLKLLPVEQNKVLLFTQENNMVILNLFNVEGNFIEFQQLNIPGKIEAVATKNKREVFLKTDTELLLINTSNMSQTRLTSSLGIASYLGYDASSNELWEISATSLNRYDGSSGAIIAENYEPIGRELSAVLFQLNR